jgi:hypothetical protein
MSERDKIFSKSNIKKKNQKKNKKKKIGKA